MVKLRDLTEYEKHGLCVVHDKAIDAGVLANHPEIGLDWNKTNNGQGLMLEAMENQGLQHPECPDIQDEQSGELMNQYHEIIENPKKYGEN